MTAEANRPTPEDRFTTLNRRITSVLIENAEIMDSAKLLLKEKTITPSVIIDLTKIEESRTIDQREPMELV